LPTVAEQLKNYRKELLGLGQGNPLIKYQSLKARGLEFSIENPVAIFRLLVREGKEMSFLPAKGVDDETTGKKQEKIYGEERRTSYHYLQTSYDAKVLESRLLKTEREFRSYIEEKGVNALYFALGMLEWYEKENSAEKCCAPLILIPVELTRPSLKMGFRLSYTGADIGDNLSLATRLKNVGVELPGLPAPDDLDLPRYFGQIEETIETRRHWRVDPYACALNLFAFTKLLMSHDLDESNWSEQTKPSKHPLLKALIETGFREPPLTSTEDDHIDLNVDTLDLTQVFDADSSQILAMLSVSQERNLIIQGPPGTGKSQTITNLIADAIGKGKRVLFVAEKLAALKVVERRLKDIGLGQACLELHSHKLKKNQRSNRRKAWSIC
jgi:Protein of unknown function (DUF4011)/AAA domain